MEKVNEFRDKLFALVNEYTEKVDVRFLVEALTGLTNYLVAEFVKYIVFDKDKIDKIDKKDDKAVVGNEDKKS